MSISERWRSTIIIAGLTTVALDCSRRSEPTLPLIVVGPADHERNIGVTGAQQLAFRLPTTPSTGYAWELVESKDGFFQKIGENRFEPGAETAPGASGFTWHNVRPRADGAVDLSWELRSPTGTGLPLQTLHFRVVARGVSPIREEELPLGFTYESTRASPLNHQDVQSSQQALSGCIHSPGKKNLCANGACTQVKDQGRCGSCWAFAATAVVENTIRKADWVTRNLSEQYIVSCNDGPIVASFLGTSPSSYCKGTTYFGDGLNYYADAYSWRKGEVAAGAVYQDDFPYSAGRFDIDHVETACNGPHEHHERIDRWDQAGGILAAGDECVKMLIDQGYFLTTFADASNWGNWGYLDVGVRTGANPAIANHVVTLVGYDDDQGVWIVRNSWGSNWGETADGTRRSYYTGGYLRIKYGGDAVAHDIAWVTYTPNQAVKASVIMAATDL